MNTQVLKIGATALTGATRTLRPGHVLALGSAGGHLEVLHGRVWLTRAGDLDDHVVAAGETIDVPASGQALIEVWDDVQPALVAWRPGTILDLLAAEFRAAFARCWDVVDPARRIGAGSLAAAVALVSGALLFGPLSDARTLALAEPGVLHNSVVSNVRVGPDAETLRGSSIDAGAGHRERARRAAQEARRHPAVPA